jgi:hypothetical protein
LEIPVGLFIVEPTKRLDEPTADEDDNCFSIGRLATTDCPFIPMVPCEQFFKSIEEPPSPILAALPCDSF